VVQFDSGNRKKISREIVDVIRREVESRSPVLMGANRSPLVQNSIGETLSVRYKETPQVMSYVLPLLVEEGFCAVSNKKPFMIRKT